MGRSLHGNRGPQKSMWKSKVMGIHAKVENLRNAKVHGQIKKGGIKSRARVKNLKRVKNRHKNHESRTNRKCGWKLGVQRQGGPWCRITTSKILLLNIIKVFPHMVNSLQPMMKTSFSQQAFQKDSWVG